MNRRHVVLLCAASLASSLGLSPGFRTADPLGESQKQLLEPPITVFFVRHAETAGSTRSGGDPELSEQGQARARVLARLLGAAGAEAYFSSEFARTQGTLRALAGDAEIAVISAREGAKQIEALRALEPGSVAVVAGHSNTVPALVLGLGGKIDELKHDARYGPMLEHYQYDRLFCVILDPATTKASTTIELRYGEACEPPAEPR